MKMTEYGKWTILLDEDGQIVANIKGHHPTVQVFIKYPSARKLQTLTNGEITQTITPRSRL